MHIFNKNFSNSGLTIQIINYDKLSQNIIDNDINHIDDNSLIIKKIFIDRNPACLQVLQDALSKFLIDTGEYPAVFVVGWKLYWQLQIELVRNVINIISIDNNILYFDNIPVFSDSSTDYRCKLLHLNQLSIDDCDQKVRLLNEIRELSKVALEEGISIDDIKSAISGGTFDFVMD